MAQVEFYIGRAGAGKTHQMQAVLRQARDEGRHAVLIVPEQFTYEAERALCSRLNGLLGVQVLSISRMREKVIAVKDRQFLSEEGRRMVIRRVAYRQKSKLKVYGGVAVRGGFAQSMNDMFARLKQAMVTPMALRAAAEKLPPEKLLARKLTDMALLYEGMQQYLDEQYIDSEDALRALIELLPHSQFVGADICFDGFEHINEQTYAILTALMLCARTLKISICAETDEQAGDYALFEPERRAYLRLYETARSLGLSVAVKQFSRTHSKKTPALRHSERQLYAYPAVVYEGDAREIAVVGANDRIAEVEALADEIARAARAGIRYRDMVVIASDLHAYASNVQRAFALRDIPLFMDVRRSMQGHPMVELTLCAVRAAAGSLYRPDLLRILKSGLSGAARADVEEFENYCLRRGLLFDQSFLTPFPAEEEAAERARAQLIPPLLALREGLKAPLAGDKTRALYAYLERLGVQEQLVGQVEALRVQERYVLMEEHAQVWGILVEMLEQLHAILGTAAMSAREYIEVLSEAVSSYQVGVIPATMDQVLLGDVARTHSREVRALFLLGCNEGLMPPPQPDQDILDDAELRELQALGTCCGLYTSSERAAGDHLALYRAVSLATERIWIGYAYTNGGGELLPARIVERVRELFPHRSEQCGEKDRLPQDERSGFAMLTRGLWQQDTVSEALRAYYSDHPLYHERLRRIEAFAVSPATPKLLGPVTAKRLYGGVYHGSVSQLSTYRRCPYMHFLQYGLRVAPRREYKEKKSDIGSFSHLVMEQFVQKALLLNGGFAALTHEETDRLLDELFPACLEQYENGLLIGSARARALSTFWVDAVRKTAHAVVRGLQASAFVPVKTELRFGVGDDIPPLRLPVLGTHMLLNGVIDRIDEAESDLGERLVRVVDYKTGDSTLHYSKLYDGTALQLPLYLLAALRGNTAPSGMYYQPVKNVIAIEGKESKAQDELLLRGILREDGANISATERELSKQSETVRGLSRKKDGALSKSSPVLQEDELRALLRFSANKATQIAAELLSGRIEANPIEGACGFCEYRGVCRFDSKLKQCRKRRVVMLKKDAFFETIGEKGGDDL